MAYRFERVYTLESNLYAEKSAVCIVAGALLRDNKNKVMLGQLKLKNIARENIISVKIRIHTYDITNQEIGNPVEYTYLDFIAEPGKPFGDQTPIALPDTNTRIFSVKILQVVFSDGSIEKYDDNIELKPLPAAHELSEDYSEELIAQYRKLTSEHSKYIPFQYKDIWFCSCGEINNRSEQKCYSCKVSKDELIKSLDHNVLHGAFAKQQGQRQKYNELKKQYFYLRSSEPIISELEKSLEKEIDQIETQIKSLGFFKAAEKKSLNETLCQKKNELSAEKSNSEKRHRDQIETLQTSLLEMSPDYILPLLTAKKGEIIEFGKYGESIKWRVLEEDNGKLLLLTEFGIACRVYNSEKQTVSWGNCSLRNWLNEEFLNTSFSSKELNIISTVKLDDGSEDKAFALSVKEVNKYFNNKEARRCIPADTAVGATTWNLPKHRVGDKLACQWWLRTPGTGPRAARVDGDGSIDESGLFVSATGLCVRPALWVDISSFDN